MAKTLADYVEGLEARGLDGACVVRCHWMLPGSSLASILQQFVDLGALEQDVEEGTVTVTLPDADWIAEWQVTPVTHVSTIWVPYGPVMVYAKSGVDTQYLIAFSAFQDWLAQWPV